MELFNGLNYLKSFQCDNPASCGNGAICNSCWARLWAEGVLFNVEPPNQVNAPDYCTCEIPLKEFGSKFVGCANCHKPIRR